MGTALLLLGSCYLNRLGLRYECEDDLTTENDPSAMSALPDGMREKLKATLEEGDMLRFCELLGQVAESNPAD